MSAIERSLPERVTRLETSVATIARGIEEVKMEIRNMSVRVDSRFDAIHAEMREIRGIMDSRFDAVHARLDSWLKWALGFIFLSRLTLMASFWLKR